LWYDIAMRSDTREVNMDEKKTPTSRGTTRQSFRCDPDIWSEFRTATGGNATAVLMAFIAWYIGKPKSRMPRRPAAQE
jgi:hypothetical protein